MLNLLYIAGADRSGTTLLSLLLARCHAVTAVGEMARYFWERGVANNERCGCSVPFGECRFWQAVRQTAFDDGQEPDPQRMLSVRQSIERHRCLPFHVSRYGGLRRPARDVKVYLTAMEQIVKAVARESGADLVVDASKIPVYAWVLDQIPDVRVRVVHLVRDSRAVAFSFQRQRSRPETAGETTLMRRRGAQDAALYWLRLNIGASLLNISSIPYLRVRYEDLVSDVDGTVQEILRFAEINNAHEQATRDGETPAIHTVSGNPVRFNTATDVRPDMEWQSEMSARDYWIVTALTLPALGLCGYPARRPRGRHPEG